MSRPWWKKLLDIFGWPQLPLPSMLGIDISVGKTDALDADGTEEWKTFTKSRALYAAWAPHPDSPWEPFHCAPLYASLDHIPEKKRGSATSEEVETETALVQSLSTWLTRQGMEELQRTLTIIDLPGPQTVCLGSDLIEHGVQCVSTFNHWPHPSAIQRCEHILARLIHFAPRVARARVQFQKNSPVAWLCDSARIGAGPARVTQYDNRYFLDDGNFPGAQLLKDQGIERIILVVSDATRPYNGDLAPYFLWLAKNGITDIRCLSLAQINEGLQPLPAPQNFTTADKLFYKRNAAGGFGKYLAPSSSSGSGG